MNKKVCFVLIGGVAFCIDTGVFSILFSLYGINIYIARIIAFIVAVCVTWYGNRCFTFKERNVLSVGKQISRAFFSAILSLLPNLIVFYFVSYYLYLPLSTAIAFILGTLAGTLSNFILSDKYIYK
ncbi:GtrA family protein [Psychromonas arctica]|uniref:GtrA family protein n=1 Tax=Psychromonas arctica TaxID=168275 RepID=UPI002FCFBB73